MTTTSVPLDPRARREQLGISRLTVAVMSDLSPSWVAALEGGLRPRHGDALGRLLAALDRLEAER
jgi:transcriptional regulator with XRE-family HTH domain